MNAHLSTLCNTVVAELVREFNDELLGVLATGSYVHGTPGPTSDLDLYVLIAASRRQRRNIVLNNVEIEMFINPPAQVRSCFGDGRGVDLHMFAFGEAIYDPSGVVAELQTEARAQWQTGPAAIDASQAWLPRYHAADLLRDLEDVAHDEADSNLLIAKTIELLLDTHYRINKRWPEKLKRRLADLAQWDVQAADLVRAVLTCQPFAVRRAALDHLAAYVLAPLGGPMPLAWSTQWDILHFQNMH